MSTRLAARWAGVFYFLIMAGALLTLAFIDSPLIVAGDTEATVDNIRAKGSLYRVGLAADAVMFFQVVLLAVFLIVLRTVDEDLALLALLLRFAEGILGAVGTLVGGVAPLLLLRSEASFDPDQLNALVQFFLCRLLLPGLRQHPLPRSPRSRIDDSHRAGDDLRVSDWSLATDQGH